MNDETDSSLLTWATSDRRNITILLLLIAVVFFSIATAIWTVATIRAPSPYETKVEAEANRKEARHEIEITRDSIETVRNALENIRNEIENGRNMNDAAMLELRNRMNTEGANQAAFNATTTNQFADDADQLAHDDDDISRLLIANGFTPRKLKKQR